MITPTNRAAEASANHCTTDAPARNPQPWDRELKPYFKSTFTNRFMAGASKRTRADILTTIKKWEAIVDDRPTLPNITDDHLAKFRDELYDEGNGLAPATVNKHLGNVSWLLGAAGPRDGHHPGALEWLTCVPWVQELHVDEKSIRTVSDEDFRAFYNACDAAVRPHAGVKPGDWWRALIVTAFTTIVRRGALLTIVRDGKTVNHGLRWSRIDDKARWVTVEGNSDKVGRVRCKRLHLDAQTHLLKIRTAADVVFLWPYSDTEYDRQWHRIERHAVKEFGLKTPFGLHDLKRTALSRLAPHVDVATLQRLGDHSSIATTLKYYVNVPDERTAAAIDDKLVMPQGIGGFHAGTDSGSAQGAGA